MMNGHLNPLQGRDRGTAYDGRRLPSSAVVCRPLVSSPGDETLLSFHEKKRSKEKRTSKIHCFCTCVQVL